MSRGDVGLIALLAVIVLFEGFDISTTSVVLPFLGKEFHAAPPTLGRALGLIALSSIAAWLLMQLADRIGRKPILLVAAAGFSLGSLATLWSVGIASYIVIQFVTRILLVTQIAMTYLIVSESLPAAVRGRANGLLGACGSIGAALPFAVLTPALFFTLYVVQERGWAPGDFIRLAPIGLAGAGMGYLLTGVMMDMIGRRWTMSVLMVALAALTQICYSAHSWRAVAGGFVGTQAALGVWVAAYTVNSELFPTALRAAANGWCNNLIGRWGVVAAPWLLGALAARAGGIGPAATLLGSASYLAVPLIWLGLPETRAARLITDRRTA